MQKRKRVSFDLEPTIYVSDSQFEEAKEHRRRYWENFACDRMSFK